LIRKIDAAVGETKMGDGWRREFMTYQVKQRDARLSGIAEGEERKAKETAKKLYQRGNSPADIADIVGYAVEVIEKWLELATI